MPLRNRHFRGGRKVTQTGMPAGTHPADSAVEYTPAEFEFLRAMERYKREHRRPHPTCCEVLAVALSLGYRKVAPADDEAVIVERN